MGWISLLGIAVALAMDAFAVSIAAGLQLRPLTKGHVFRLAFHFGFFQAAMPIAGWFAGATVSRSIADYDHWIALALLGFIGGKMVYGATRAGAEAPPRATADPTRGWTLIGLSFATSIDALAVGLSLAMLGVSIWVPSLVIGVVCAGFTTLGMLIGWRLGRAWSRRVELFGGVVLIAIGVKIVLEHLLAK